MTLPAARRPTRNLRAPAAREDDRRGDPPRLVPPKEDAGESTLMRAAAAFRHILRRERGRERYVGPSLPPMSPPPMSELPTVPFHRAEGAPPQVPPPTPVLASRSPLEDLCLAHARGAHILLPIAAPGLRDHYQQRLHANLPHARKRLVYDLVQEGTRPAENEKLKMMPAEKEEEDDDEEEEEEEAASDNEDNEDNEDDEEEEAQPQTAAHGTRKRNAELTLASARKKPTPSWPLGTMFSVMFAALAGGLAWYLEVKPWSMLSASSPTVPAAPAPAATPAPPPPTPAPTAAAPVAPTTSTQPSPPSLGKANPPAAVAAPTTSAAPAAAPTTAVKATPPKRRVGRQVRAAPRPTTPSGSPTPPVTIEISPNMLSDALDNLTEETRR